MFISAHLILDSSSDFYSEVTSLCREAQASRSVCKRLNGRFEFKVSESLCIRFYTDPYRTPSRLLHC